MISPDDLEEIVYKYEAEENYPRLIFRIISCWGEPIDEDLLIYWLVKCHGLSTVCAEDIPLFQVADDLMKKGFNYNEALDILMKGKAIYSYTKENKKYFARSKYFKGK